MAITANKLQGNIIQLSIASRDELGCLGLRPSNVWWGRCVWLTDAGMLWRQLAALPVQVRVMLLGLLVQLIVRREAGCVEYMSCHVMRCRRALCRRRDRYALTITACPVQKPTAQSPYFLSTDFLHISQFLMLPSSWPTILFIWGWPNDPQKFVKANN